MIAPPSHASLPTAPVPLRRAAEVLESERLRFRLFRDADFPIYEQWCARIEIMRYLGGKTFDRIQAWRHFAYLRGHWEFLGYGYYAVEERATGTLIGRVGYTNQPGWPGFELGWTIIPEYQGRGYATEAAKFLLPYAFDVLDQSRVLSLIHPDNAPSRRVAEKLGQRIEGETEVLTMPVLIYAATRPEHKQ
jgi:RimJ/RimL family protein N-acetyltransferase